MKVKVKVYQSDELVLDEEFEYDKDGKVEFWPHKRVRVVIERDYGEPVTPG